MSHFTGSSPAIKSLFPSRRWIIVMVCAILVAIGSVVDSSDHRSVKPVSRPPVDPAVASLTATASSATSSAWYCAATPATRAKPADGSVVIFNPGSAIVTGTATFAPVGGDDVDAPFTVPAHSRIALHPGDVVDAAFAATMVTSAGGGIAVEHGMNSAGGESFSPCSANTSSTWYMGDGSTIANVSLKLALFNPFLDSQIADVDFVTDAGRASPTEMQGVVVPPRSLVLLDVSSSLRRRNWVVGTVSIRSGGVVVDQIQASGARGDDAVSGNTLTAVMPSTSSHWYFPDGVVGEGVTDNISMFNPGDTEASVTMTVIADASTDPNVPKAIAPFDLKVAPHSRMAVSLGNEVRIPKNTRYSLVIKTSGATPIVVARTSTATAPATVIGSFIETGAASTAKHWEFPYGGTAAPRDEWIWLENPGGSAADVTLTAISDGVLTLIGSTVHIDAGRRAAVRLDDPTANKVVDPSVVINSTQPIVAGREMRRVNGTWVSGSVGIIAQ